MTFLLANYSKNLTAIEPSEIYLAKAVAKCKHLPIQFIQGILEEHQSNQKYNLIILTGVLEHTRDDFTFLEKVKSLLDKDGRIIITVPNAFSLHRKIGLKLGKIKDLHELGELDLKVGHFRYYSPDTLNRILEKAGFKILRSAGIMLKPFPNDKMEFLDSNYCDALFEVGLELPEYCAETFAICSICHSI